MWNSASSTAQPAALMCLQSRVRWCKETSGVGIFIEAVGIAGVGGVGEVVEVVAAAVATVVAVVKGAVACPTGAEAGAGLRDCGVRAWVSSPVE